MTALPAILSTIIFFGSLALIFSEQINRSIVAIAGSVLMIGVGTLFNF